MPVGNVSASAGAAQQASLTSAKATTNTAQSQGGQGAAQASGEGSTETVDHSIPLSTGNNVDVTA